MIHTHTDFSRVAGEGVGARICRAAQKAHDEALEDFKAIHPGNQADDQVKAWRAGYASEIVKLLSGLAITPHQMGVLLRQNGIRGR